jgi:dipeptidyl aminopeptidase/acylaminoacyl peptidase
MKLRRLFAYLAVLLLFASILTVNNRTANAQKSGGYTLAQIMSSPFPSELTAASTGGHIAWAFDAQGKRNIWVASAPDFKARQLTHYNKDDGQEITQVSISRDGSSVAYTRGSDKNTVGEIANPTSDAAGQKQQVWAMRWTDTAPHLMGEGSAPDVSPTGAWVAFTREGQIYLSPVTGATKAKQAFVGRGTNSNPTWLPTGDSFVFVSNRGDHSFIGVFDVAKDEVRWISPSVDRDSTPRLSPDGKQVAFVRQFNARGGGGAGGGQGRGAFAGGRWSIMIADVATGNAKEFWHSGEQSFGIYRNLGENAFMWGADNTFVFASEQDGWSHLYRLPAGAASPTLLTPGECEVEHIAMTPDRKTVVYSNNCGDIDRRHLSSVAVAGGTPTKITSGDKIEWSPVVTGDGDFIAYLGSDAKMPAMPYVRSLAGGNSKPVAAEVLPKDFPASQLVIPQQVIFKSADGWEIHAQLFLPPGTDGKTKLPALIHTHGGPPRQMLLGWHYLYYYHNAYAMNQYMASRGYAVLTVNYRLGIGYGRAFRNAPKSGAQGGSEYQDVVAGAKYLQSRADVDSSRIGLWGGSYGGYLTAMGLAHNSDIFKAGVDMHGVHDWSVRVAGLPGATPQNAEATKIALESSPVSAMAGWKSPVLLIHGDDDRNVAFSQTVELVRLLRAQNVEFEQLIFPDEIHDFLLHKDWLAAYAATADFFDRKLKAGN